MVLQPLPRAGLDGTQQPQLAPGVAEALTAALSPLLASAKQLRRRSRALTAPEAYPPTDSTHSAGPDDATAAAAKRAMRTAMRSAAAASAPSLRLLCLPLGTASYHVFRQLMSSLAAAGWVVGEQQQLANNLLAVDLSMTLETLLSTVPNTHAQAPQPHFGLQTLAGMR